MNASQETCLLLNLITNQDVRSISCFLRQELKPFIPWVASITPCWGLHVWLLITHWTYNNSTKTLGKETWRVLVENKSFSSLLTIPNHSCFSSSCTTNLSISSELFDFAMIDSLFVNSSSSSSLFLSCSPWIFPYTSQSHFASYTMSLQLALE